MGLGHEGSSQNREVQDTLHDHFFQHFRGKLRPSERYNLSNVLGLPQGLFLLRPA